MTNLGNLGRIGAEGTHAPAGRSHVAEGPPAREASVPAPQGPRRRAAERLKLLVLYKHSIT